jgi:CBS domain containing-hemolysin-like protein
MTLLIIYILTALVVSFICSLLEAGLLTITPSAIASAKQRGVRWAPKMEALKADIDRPLAAILTLNTVAHTMGPPERVPSMPRFSATPVKRSSPAA